MWFPVKGIHCHVTTFRNFHSFQLRQNAYYGVWQNVLDYYTGMRLNGIHLINLIWIYSSLFCCCSCHWGSSACQRPTHTEDQATVGPSHTQAKSTAGPSYTQATICWIISHSGYCSISHSDYWLISHSDYWLISHSGMLSTAANKISKRPWFSFCKQCIATKLFLDHC